MYKAPRGTDDILPEQQPYWRYLEETAAAVCKLFGYERMDTPIFEDAGLFVRSVGEGSDIVDKEMYSFEDRGSDRLTLRPEGTASVCRAYLEHGMPNLPQPVRLYSARVPMFRYDRPQAGRYRQFHQFNVEAIGDADPSVDAEIIEVAWRFLERLGLKGLTLSLNSIGDPACRPSYLEALRAYYAPHVSNLCPDCQKRFERNTLRLLDCKRESCQPIADKAPASTDYLCSDCRAHWDSLKRYLQMLGIPFQTNNRLVRGLDYYTRTVFEVQPPEEKAQAAITGGGRYDGLIQQLGGRPTPGVGFAAGFERIILNLQRQGITVPPSPPPEYFVAYLGDVAKAEAVRLASAIRMAGRTAILASGRSLRGQLRQANALRAAKAIVIGEDELARKVVKFKELATGEEKEIEAERFISFVTGAETK